MARWRHWQRLCVNPVAGTLPDSPKSSLDADGVRASRGRAGRKDDLDRGRVGSGIAALGDIDRLRAGDALLVAVVPGISFREGRKVAPLRNGDLAVLRRLRQPHHRLAD